MREGWREARLGDVAAVSSTAVPLSSVTLPYIGLEHFDSGSPAIVRSALSSDMSGSGILVQPGDVLFSKLRPYLNKVAVAHETAVCSTEVLVWRPKLDTGISKAFLSLVLRSKESIDFANRSSKGTKMPRTSATAMVALPIALPPLSEQYRIVDLMTSVDTAIAAAEAEATAGRSSYMAHLTAEFTSGASFAPLGAALSRSEDRTRVEPDATYRLVGVLRSGEGFIDRGVEAGENIGYSTLTRVRENQLVYRKLTAWEGPISVSTQNEDGGFVSSEFPVFEVDSSRLLPDLLRHYCRWPGLWSLMQQRLKGSVLRRMRLNADQLEAIAVPMPGLTAQETSLRLLDSQWEHVATAHATAEALRTLRSNLLTVLLSGEHEIPESYDHLLNLDDEDDKGAAA
ncbi:restriction endonuclease subunit S [Microbacterium sp. nov. GSS16]|uniref:restriction endonuclease subunit S n=1 Tax=Microbacterium sp. nov. GSS16 TaxID=3019890 RepID=UPI002306683C|nr:restriction endonuclease subunit S [Microbacterium sp. nov. GSS16]WCD91456.1 restriction endonuclease subunit S [Microbacterium sp. nov. GSS16]